MSSSVKLHPNQLAERISGRNYISFSAISTYAACPLRYNFKYLEDLPEEIVSSSLAFGGGIHAAIELWFNEQMIGSPEPNHETLLAAFWDSWQVKNEGATIAFKKGETVNTVGRLADRVLAAFRESELAHPPGRVIGVEEELRGAIVPSAPDLLARVDLLVEADEALVVTDFKTTRSPWKREQAEDQSEQLLLYSELARQLAPEKTVRLEFAVITKSKIPIAARHPVQLNRQRLDRTKLVVARVWRAIETGNFYPAPSPLNCPTCPYRKPCRAWKG
jgi:CRISPR/Cas system-associated exonuclease Cas4 (RecB family)